MWIHTNELRHRGEPAPSTLWRAEAVGVTEDTIPDSIPSMAPVAQMAERRTSIPKVVGSNPTWSEIFGFRSWARN